MLHIKLEIPRIPTIYFTTDTKLPVYILHWMRRVTPVYMMDLTFEYIHRSKRMQASRLLYFLSRNSHSSTCTSNGELSNTKSIFLFSKTSYCKIQGLQTIVVSLQALAPKGYLRLSPPNTSTLLIMMLLLLGTGRSSPRKPCFVNA